jgi:hypothetical protein
VSRRGLVGRPRAKINKRVGLVGRLRPKINKSFFAAFFSKKAALTSFLPPVL